MAAPPKTPPKNWLRRWWRQILTVVLVGGAVAALSHWLTVDQVRDYADGVNPVLAFVLLVVLPLVGCPVTVLHVVAGMRFGTGLGLTLVGISIVLQLCASYALVHFFRERFTQWLGEVGKRVPKTAYGTMCLFTLLLPGVPYFAKNYVLPLLGVPLRTYLMWCLPIHLARSVMAVVFGDQSDDLTPGRIAGLVVYGLTVAAASWWMWRRLRSQFGDRPKVGGGRKQPA